MNKKNILLGAIAFFLLGNYGIDITQYVYDEPSELTYEAQRLEDPSRGVYVAKVVFVKESSNPPFVDRYGPVDHEFNKKPTLQELEKLESPLSGYVYDTTLYVVAVRKSLDELVDIPKEKETPNQ